MATLPTVDELEKKEEELFRTGPLSVLTSSVKTNSQVLDAGCLIAVSSSVLASFPVSVVLERISVKTTFFFRLVQATNPLLKSCS